MAMNTFSLDLALVIEILARMYMILGQWRLVAKV